MDKFIKDYMFYVGAFATTLIAFHYSRKFYNEYADYRKNKVIEDLQKAELL